QLLEYFTLIAHKTEELVANDSSAKGAAKLILVKLVLAGGEEVGGIDVVVADELKCVPVPPIRSRASNHVDKTARVQTALRAQSRGFHAELGYRVRERKREIDVGHVVVVIGAIQPVVGGIALPAADGDHRRTVKRL